MEVNYLVLVGEGYMGSMQWQLGREMGTIPAFASRTQENQEPVSRWPVAGPSGFWLLASRPASKSGAFAYTPEASVFFVMSFLLHISTRLPLGRFS